MRAALQRVLTILLFLVTSISFAGTEPAPWFSKGADNQLKLRVDLYISTTCSHCQKEDAFIHELQKQKPWLDIHRYEINLDKAALEKFHQALEQQKSDDYSVPALFFCDSRWVGFDKVETTGRALARSLDYCYQQISKTGQLNPEPKAILKLWSNSSVLATTLTDKPAYVFIPLMALSDALSSCSIFAVLALFAFLWLFKEKSRILGLGILFIVVVAIVHHYQQAHAIFFYHALPWLRIPAALIGLGLIAYVYIIYSKGSNIRTGLAIPILVGITALIIEAYQQTCLPNFALVFTQWLDLQQISLLHRKFYVIIYNLIYILPLTLILALIIYYRAYKKMERSKPLLVCLAWCLLLVIGLIAIIYPQGFSNLLLSVAALLVSLIAAWETLRKSSQLSPKGDSYFGDRHE
jgi:glutaredoxin